MNDLRCSLNRRRHETKAVRNTVGGLNNIPGLYPNDQCRARVAHQSEQQICSSKRGIVSTISRKGPGARPIIAEDGQSIHHHNDISCRECSVYDKQCCRKCTRQACFFPNDAHTPQHYRVTEVCLYRHSLQHYCSPETPGAWNTYVDQQQRQECDTKSIDIFWQSLGCANGCDILR